MSDLRDTIRAAMSGEPAPEPVSTPEPTSAPILGESDAMTGEPLIPPKVEAKEPKAPEASENAEPERPRRRPDGTFAPKDDNTAPAAEGAKAAAPAPEPKEPESAKPEGEGAQDAPTRIPPSLSAAVKAQWNDLPPAVRDEFSRLEGTFIKGKAEWEGKGQRLNRFDEILAPHADRWRLNGLDEFSGIQSLIAAQSMLDRDPVGGIVQIARSYGLTPAHLAQAFGVQQTNGTAPAGAEGQPAPTSAPDFDAALQRHLSPVLERVQTLQQQLQQRQQEEQANSLSSAQATVAEFASKPENMYFENVREDVARRLESGAAKNLQEAYDQAIWASPEIRPHLLQAQIAAETKARADAEAEARRAAEQAARDKANAARQAAGSVTGAPAPGSEPPQGRSSGNLREDLIAARQQVMSAV